MLGANKTKEERPFPTTVAFPHHQELLIALKGNVWGLNKTDTQQRRIGLEFGGNTTGYEGFAEKLC